MIPDIDLGTPASDALDWVLDHAGGLFDAVGDRLATVVDGPSALLEAPPPLVVIVVLALLPALVRRWGIALFSLLAFALVEAMGLWPETMQSLAVVLVATVVAVVVVAIPLGIWSARRRAVSAVLRPVLNLTQTTPPFGYLIPAVFFFGIGVVPGVVATAVFALAPAVRLTELGIRQVDAEVVEVANAFGARPGQLLRDVQLPLALPSIMAGVNQVIMLALSMVVLAAYLDPVTGALADPRSTWSWWPRRGRRDQHGHRRHGRRGGRGRAGGALTSTRARPTTPTSSRARTGSGSGPSTAPALGQPGSGGTARPGPLEASPEGTRQRPCCRR